MKQHGGAHVLFRQVILVSYFSQFSVICEGCGKTDLVTIEEDKHSVSEDENNRSNQEAKRHASFSWKLFRC